MLKRVLAGFLATVLAFQSLPTEALAQESEETGTVSVSNEYLQVVVNKENGGYTINTKEGDLRKDTDNNKKLLHSGECYDSSFTSFQVGGEDGKEYIFGNDYLFAENMKTTSDTEGITSEWSVGGIRYTQRIELVNNEASEQLGTAQIIYTVENMTDSEKSIKSRLLMDTQLGDQDYAVYEAGDNVLGNGFQGYVTETELDSTKGQFVPSDYFARDGVTDSSMAAFGVNGVNETEKPYKMIFAHWANLASTKFDYMVDEKYNFTSNINSIKTADSAVALYYDLGVLGAGESKSFSTYYGVTANLKNKENQVLINTTAPNRMNFNEARTAFVGSSGLEDNRVRISTTVTNPEDSGITWKNLRVVVYAIGISAERQDDSGKWTVYDNINPLCTEIENFTPGKSIPTYFDFQFTPKDSHELGSFVTKVYNFDPQVNELGVYAEDFCIGTTENTIYIPAKDPTLPTISILSVEPQILYNENGRYLTMSGKGMTFLNHNSFRYLELRNEADESVTYQVKKENMAISADGTSVSFYLNEYMVPGKYNIHLIWDTSAENRPNGIPEDIHSDGMAVVMTDDVSYRNDSYGILAVSTGSKNTYKVTAFRDESAYEKYRSEIEGDLTEEILLTLRGSLVKENDSENYRICGKDTSITINNALLYEGNNFEVRVNGGSVEIAMDGKLTTVGASTSVRNGTAYIKLKEGTEYVIPVYNSRGETLYGDTTGENQEYMQLSWDGSYSFLQSVGGFLVDLRYGIFGKMNDTTGNSIDENAKSYDIISFGGGLDLSFMTPGGAKVARENQSKSSSWTFKKMDSTSGLDPYGFESWVSEEAPEQKEVTKLSGGVAIDDILYGNNGKKTGYLGINMNAHLTLPNIVSFLPNSMEGDLAINTIGGYEVGVSGEAKTLNFNMAFALVVKGNESGAPIPDKMYFTLGGFEPGVNVDGLGVFWLTGGGGGFENLYDTIYGTDGLPPLTLLLNVQFDLVKVMTGTADLSLSLRSIGVELSDVSLKFVKQARFLDGGSIHLAWYPSMEVSVQGRVNFMQIFKGSFSVIGTEDLFEMMMRVAISLPSYIPVVGGMEVASAELGGGTEKMWGSVTLLEIIRLGFTYYWDSGKVSFKVGKSRTAKAAYARMTQPRAVDYDETTGETQYLQIGSNLNFVCGSGKDVSLTDADIRLLSTKGSRSIKSKKGSTNNTSIQSNVEVNKHLITLTPGKNYLVTVNTVSASDSLTKDCLLVQKNGTGENVLDFYSGEGTLAEKQEDAQSSNVNMVGEGKDAVAYIALKGDASPYLLTATREDGTGLPVSVGVVEVEALPELTGEVTATKNENQLNVSWNAQNATEDTKLHITLSEEAGEKADVILAELSGQDKITAGTVDVTIPDSLPSGNYYVNVTIIEEGKTYSTLQSKSPISHENSKAPESVEEVKLENCGNNKLEVKITDDFTDEKVGGYYVDVYEDNELKESGLYFTKEQAKNGELRIGGSYEMMEYETLSNGEAQETGNTVNIGYTPGKTYQVSVRAASAADDSGENTYCSSKKNSEACVLREQKLPNITFNVNGVNIPEEEAANMAEDTAELIIKSDIPVKGTLSVDGAEGKVYEYDTTNTQFTESLSLTDGEHILEFSCENQQGDKKILTKSVVVDTKAPLLLVETPISGDVIRNGQVNIKAVAENDAKYTFSIDGTVIGEADRDLNANISNGLLDLTLDVPKNMDTYVSTLTILAKDAAGNETTVSMELQNGDLISKLANELKYTELCAENEETSEGIVDISETKRLSLSMIGVLKDGTKIDLTKLPGTTFEIASGDAAFIVDGNVVETTGAGGESQVIGKFEAELGSGVTFEDALRIKTGEPELKYYTISLIEGDGYEYVKTTQSDKIPYGDSYKFKVEVKAGYTKTENFVVKANDVALNLDAEGYYCIENIQKDQTISVEGVLDQTAPTAKISIAENKWESFLNTITFGHFYNKSQMAEITAEDAGSGVADISYYISEQPLTEIQLKDSTLEWKNYTDPLKLDAEGEYIVYAKVADKAGNKVYVNSQGVVLLIEAPVVTGIQDGGVYYGEVTAKVVKKYVESVTSNGENIAISQDGTFTLSPTGGVQEIVVTDKAGNQTKMKITIYTSTNGVQENVVPDKAGDQTEMNTSKEEKVKIIKITGISKQIAVGKKIQLTANISPENANNKNVTWKSSNKKYATVSSKGVVKTQKAGKNKTVMITAIAEDGSGTKATYKIKIMPNAVKKVSLKASKAVKAGKKLTIKATVTPNLSSKKINKKLIWSISNKKYATVSSKGVVKTYKAGKGRIVTITAMSTDGTKKKAKIKIKIK